MSQLTTGSTAPCPNNPYIESCSNNVNNIINDISYISDETNCQDVYNFWNQAVNVGLCNNLFTGLYALWITQFVTSGCLFFVMCFASVLYQYYGEYWTTNNNTITTDLEENNNNNNTTSNADIVIAHRESSIDDTNNSNGFFNNIFGTKPERKVATPRTPLIKSESMNNSDFTQSKSRSRSGTPERTNVNLRSESPTSLKARNASPGRSTSPTGRNQSPGRPQLMKDNSRQIIYSHTSNPVNVNATAVVEEHEQEQSNPIITANTFEIDNIYQTKDDTLI